MQYPAKDEGLDVVDARRQSARFGAWPTYSHPEARTSNLVSRGMIAATLSFVCESATPSDVVLLHGLQSAILGYPDVPEHPYRLS